MQVKKYPYAKLENYSKILIQLGLVLALFIVYEFFKMKSYPRQVENLTGAIKAVDNSEETVVIKTPEPEVQPAAKAIIPEKILKVHDEIEVPETIIESTETDESEAIEINVDEQLVAVEEEETIVEDVPFVVIEEVPVYPGCRGNNKELRDCFSKNITKFVSKKFNTELASDLGLAQGSVQRIYVMFKIDSKGNIADIRARAPHKKLKSEAIRVINLLPKMTPGRQRGKPVGVSYSLPIVFKVE